MQWRQAFRAYAAHADPLVAAGNLIALVVASSQPFYPLYVYWIVGREIEPTLFTFISTPFFLAVPALARRHPLAGRVLLPLAGILNTAMCAKLLGEASGVELFFLPCVLIAAMLFRPGERLATLCLLGLAFLIYFALHGRYGAPLHAYTDQEYTSFLRLHAFSVGVLSTCVGLAFANALATIEGRRAKANAAPRG